MILQPPATLILGETGAGKTDVIPTFIEAGIETFVIITEPTGVDTLLDSVSRRKLDINKLHWTSCLPAAAGWQAMTDMANTIGTTGYEDITKLKSGVGKSETRKPAMKLLESLSNFHCERTGKDYGDTSKWGNDRALCLDSLSGLSLLSMALTIGYKPAAHQGEWGVAMNFLEQVLLKITSDRQCFLGVTAHIEKELNELTGANQVMASVLGRKLAPKIPRFFSEVVRTKKLIVEGKAKFVWSNMESDTALKNRALPLSSNLEPSFVPVVESFRARMRLAGAPSSPAPAAPVPVPAPTSAVVPPASPMRPATPATSQTGASK